MIVSFVLPVISSLGRRTPVVSRSPRVLATLTLLIVKDSSTEPVEAESSVRTRSEPFVPERVAVIESEAPVKAVALKFASVSLGADLIVTSTGLARSANVTASIPAILVTD